MRKLKPILSLVSLVFACSPAGTKKKDLVAEGKSHVPVSALTLGEPSHLAKLMRIMEAHGDSVAVALEAGNELPPYPDAISALTTAEPTEGMHIDEITFPVFAETYQEKVAALYEVSESERTDAYNMVIQSCANCHYAHCPGPLMKIEKMFVGRGD